MRLAVVAAAACLALAACGGDGDGPDVDEVESDLAPYVAEVTGTRDVSVNCPEDVGEGDVCDITAPGGVRAQIRITGIDEEEVTGELVQP